MEQMPNFEGNRGRKTLLGNREHKKTNYSFFGEQGNKPIYFRGTREQVTPSPLGKASFICKEKISEALLQLLILASQQLKILSAITLKLEKKTGQILRNVGAENARN